MSNYSESVDLTQAPTANTNRASEGYSQDVVLAMVAHLGPGYWYEGDTLGQRDNHLPGHEATLEAAARVLKGYGVRVRRQRCGGKLRAIRVFAPKRVAA